MADGPTVANSGGGGGGAVAAVVAIIGLVVLFFTGVIDFGGTGGTRNVDVDVNLPKVESPSTPAPAAPSAPADGG